VNRRITGNCFGMDLWFLDFARKARGGHSVEVVVFPHRAFFRPYSDERPDKKGSAVVTIGGTVFFNRSSSA
jgi:hypothetical protein